MPRCFYYAGSRDEDLYRLRHASLLTFSKLKAVGVFLGFDFDAVHIQVVKGDHLDLSALLGGRELGGKFERDAGQRDIDEIWISDMNGGIGVGRLCVDRNLVFINLVSADLVWEILRENR